MDEDWDLLQSFFPAQWRQLAAEHGALKGLRQDKDPESFLRTLLMHVGCGYSLRETSARVKQAGIADLSDVAVLKRLRKAEQWLHALCVELFSERLGSLDQVGCDRNLRLVDGSLISEPGKTGSTWRLHYSMRWPTLLCDFFELTPCKGSGTGETLSRYPASKGDHLLGDRGFCNAKAIHQVVEAGADVTIRLNPHNIRIYPSPDIEPEGASDDPKTRKPGREAVSGANGAPQLDLLGFVGELKEEWAATSCAVELADKNDRNRTRGRICLLRKSQEAIRQSLKKLARREQKTGEKTKPETKIFAEYVMVFTTLPENEADAEGVLAQYRLRWQVELVFKRFKQLANLGHLPKSDPQSSRAWLYGKLFTVLLTEKLVAHAERLSPWGYDSAKIEDEKPMARVQLHVTPSATRDRSPHLAPRQR